MGARSGPEGTSRLLLQELLVHIRRAGHTPLQSRIDGLGIVQAAARRLQSRLGGVDADFLADPAAVTAALDDLLVRVLSESPAESVPDVEALGAPSAPIPEETLRELSRWLDRRYVPFRSVDPNALEILGLRLEGCDDRDIAGRLALGPRLVRHIVRDLRESVLGGVAP